MPPARSASAAARSQTRSTARAAGAAAPSQPRPADRAAGARTRYGRPQSAPARSPRLRVRWERVGRIGLLLVLGVVVALYVEHTMSYLSARSQATRQEAIVQSLQRQNAQLLRQQRSLNDPRTIAREARALGMVRPGEQPYVILGRASGH